MYFEDFVYFLLVGYVYGFDLMVVYYDEIFVGEVLYCFFYWCGIDVELGGDFGLNEVGIIGKVFLQNGGVECVVDCVDGGDLV